MATQETGVTAYETLGSDINKSKLDSSSLETKQGVVSEKLPELSLDMSNEDIVKLTDSWEKSWKDSNAKQTWEKQIEENENYWLGKHFDTPQADKTRPMIDNLVFEALETYLPQATRRNPEPLVTLDNSEDSSPEKEKYVEKLKKRLGDLADKNKLRLKLKKGARHWAIYQLGVAKFGWDLDKDMPIVRIVRPKKLILDPEATIDEDGYTGNRIGEVRKLEGSKILAIIGETDTEAVAAVNDLLKDKTATEIQFQEWWTPEYMCWKLGSKIILKRKNPHWNYDGVEQDTSVDEYGNETPVQNESKGINHLTVPTMPYVFLSIFNLGDQPMDKTSLIGQNLANQDLINKRNKQIDKNADSMNGGIVVSLARSGLTQTQAKGVTEALRKGGTIVIPDGSPREAIDRYPAPGLPADVYNQLADTRSRLRDIFGVKGSSQAGLTTEDTVRGKIMARGLDTDRIGGGVSEYLEQFADDIYNWFVQLLYVYDTGFQFVKGAVPPKVCVSVKEGSLLPKDSTSIANQALDLARLNRISNLDLYKRLEFPNAEELAANVWLEANAPQLLYKDNPLVQEALAMQQQAKAAEAEMKMKEDQMKYEQDMQKEKMKGAMKVAGERAKGSMLSEVETEEAEQE
jgi:hypothetical protein